MQDKLEKILKQISLDEDSYEYFSNGILDKVIIKDNIKLWEIIIKLDKNLPLSVYLELENKVKSTFNKIEVIKIKLIPISIDYNELEKYYNYLIDIIQEIMLDIIRLKKERLLLIIIY